MVPRVEPGSESEIAEFRSHLLRDAAGIDRPLTEIEADRLTKHFRLLRQWGKRMNLTGLRDPEAILKRHFLEPIAASAIIAGSGRLVDLGSGNGFPAIPLAVLHPGVDLVLVEASEKKSSFLWAVVRALGLKSAQVVTRRVCRRADLKEVLPSKWITYRGVKAAVMLAGELPALLQEGGRLLAFVSEADAGTMRSRPPDGLRSLETLVLPASPGDVVEVFAPIG
jgi:16S rRNA (guanine(527)-N(7))-methyltransferase RsmG